MFNPNDILYEDNHLLVVNKRVGDLVQPDKTSDDALERCIGEVDLYVTAITGALSPPSPSSYREGPPAREGPCGWQVDKGKRETVFITRHDSGG